MRESNHAKKNDRPSFTAPVLSSKLFQAIGRFVTAELGIKMPDAKRTMLQSRLQKRLRQLNMQTFEAYYDYILSDQGRQQELHHFLDAVTTNKTDFFREPRHYSVLTDSVLPELMVETGAGILRPLKIWSAGCSTGAEPYTVAMVLENFAQDREGLKHTLQQAAGNLPSKVLDRFQFRSLTPQQAAGNAITCWFKYRILATDICTRVLSVAHSAIFDEKDADPIPMPLKKKYLLRSKDRARPRIRMAPEIRRMVEFRRLNFMDADYDMANTMDIILCRNVIIYFDRPTQYIVLKRLCRCLRSGGFLFTGHSETLNGFELPLHQFATNVYRKFG